ncbi:MAG: DsrE family protein [Propionibacteriaceae bacterium]|nr:DsrE family protein [Propionibacteriaceae bacterium]
MGSFCVSISHAKDNVDKATVAFVVANAAVGSDQDTTVFVSSEGVHLATQGYADDMHEEGFAPLKELIDSFVEAGGKIWVCSPCFKKRGYTEDQLIEGTTMVGGAKLVELLAGGAAHVSY